MYLGCILVYYLLLNLVQAARRRPLLLLTRLTFRTTFLAFSQITQVILVFMRRVLTFRAARRSAGRTSRGWQVVFENVE